MNAVDDELLAEKIATCGDKLLTIIASCGLTTQGDRALWAALCGWLLLHRPKMTEPELNEYLGNFATSARSVYISEHPDLQPDDRLH